MIKPINHKGYKLLHEGAIALSQVEANGMKIDTDYLNKAIKQTSTQIEVISDKLKTHKIYKQWKKRYGSKTNLDSPEQLGKILFDCNVSYPTTK